MRLSIYLGLILIAVSACNSYKNKAIGGAQMWTTSADKGKLLDSTFIKFSKSNEVLPLIEIDTTIQYQAMDGFGFALTGGSAMLLHQLDSVKRNQLIQELFGTKKGIGISYLRISIGASDLDDHVFSYDDLEKGDTDPELKKFNLNYDTLHLIPLLKEILIINPSLKIMASPWSPPLWMKTNQAAKGGSLKPEYNEAYANYIMQYVKEMENEKIIIDAITIQNEPENPNNTPSLLMTAVEQKDFIKNHLGPLLQKEKIETKIIIFDHNADHPAYPISILNDSIANTFIDGTAFHLYLGEITALSKVHNAHSTKNIYFTEQWTSGKGDFGNDLEWHIENIIIGATRNWSKVVLEWNLAADENFNPHTPDGGCTLCQGALTIGKEVKRNVSYYIIAQASKFVLPGSVRVFSSELIDFPNVAFSTPQGKKVLIIFNKSSAAKKIKVKEGKNIFEATVMGKCVSTFIW